MLMLYSMKARSLMKQLMKKMMIPTSLRFSMKQLKKMLMPISLKFSGEIIAPKVLVVRVILKLLLKVQMMMNSMTLMRCYVLEMKIRAMI